jgi:hypothetical protein
MPLKEITFLSFKPHPQQGNVIECHFTFSVIDTSLVGMPEELAATDVYAIVVKMSRSLQAVWKLQSAEMEKVMYEYAKRHLDEHLALGVAAFSRLLDYTTATAPLRCPYNPGSISMEPGDRHIVITKE